MASLFPFWINVATFSPEGIFNLRDFNVPFDILANFKQMSYVWNSNLGFGYPNFSVNLVLIYHLPLLLFKSIGLNLLSSEKMYLSLVLFCVGMGCYIFLSNYLSFEEDGNKRIGCLLGALFYMFNIQVNQRFIGVPHTAIAIGVFPLLLLCLSKIIDFSQEKKYLFFALCQVPNFLDSYSLSFFIRRHFEN